MQLKKNINYSKLSSILLGLACFYINYTPVLSQDAAALDWVRSTKGAGDDISQQSRGLVKDSEDNIYEYGFFLDSVDFADESQTPHHINTNEINVGYYIAKHSSQGNLISVNAFSAEISSMTILEDDGFIISGLYTDSVDMDFSENEYFLHANSNYEAFLARYDKDLNLLWAITTSSNSAIQFQDIAVCKLTQRVYVSGTFRNTVDFNPDPNESYEVTTGSSAKYHAFVASYSLNGEFLWLHHFNVQTVSGMDRLYYVNCDDEGNFYFTGHFADTVQLDPLELADSIVSVSNGSQENDVFVAKYDSDYNFQWVSLMQGISRSIVRDIETDEGFIYLTGSTNNEMTVYSADREDSVVLGFNIRARLFLVKLSIVNGGINWAFVLKNNGSASCSGHYCFLGETNDIYVSGRLRGNESIDFNPNPDNEYLITNNSTHQECFVAKYSKEGDFLWAFSTPGGVRSKPSGLTVLSNEKVVVTGIFRGTVDVSGHGQGDSITTDVSPSINNFSFTAAYKQGMLSTNEVTATDGISLYPNPATDKQIIELSGHEGKNAKITLYDIQGRSLGVVHEGKLEDETVLEFNVSGLSNGFYLYDVRMETERRTLRFIKQ